MNQAAIKKPANKNDQNEFSFLPADIGQALKFLIMISEKMIAIAERETQALIQGDMMSFSILQNEKETLSIRYARASAEFRQRLEEFRKADTAQLTRLENLQRRLGEVTLSNKEIVDRVFKRAQQKTHESLITVQELSQQKRVNENNILKNINGAQAHTGQAGA